MNNNYKCVTTLEELKAYIGNSKIVSFDYETAPDDVWRQDEKASLDAHRAHIVECSYSIASHTIERHSIIRNDDNKNQNKCIETGSELTKY